MSQLTHDQNVSIAEDVLIQDLDGDSILLNFKSEQFFDLNEVGTRMLSVLTESKSVQAAYDQLLDEYDVDAQRLRQDLLDLIEKLVEYGLAEVTKT